MTDAEHCTDYMHETQRWIHTSVNQTHTVHRYEARKHFTVITEPHYTIHT